MGQLAAGAAVAEALDGGAASRGQKRLPVTAAAGPRLAVNVPMPAAGHPDAPVFQLLGEVLSGDDGLLATELITKRQVATSARASGSPSSCRRRATRRPCTMRRFRASCGTFRIPAAEGGAWTTRSLRAQCDHRVDPGRAPGRKPGCELGHDQQRGSHREIDDWVRRTHVEERLLHQPRDEKRPMIPSTRPRSVSRRPWPRTIRMTVRGDAPSAMRMPISLVRNATR